MAETNPVDPDNPLDPAPRESPGEPAAADRAGGGAPALAFVCPTCSESILLAEAPANGLVECPFCSAQFFAATDPGQMAEDARAEAEADAARDRRDAELSELRVRQVSTLRRSMIRTRGYYLTGAWACIGAGLELAWLAALNFYELHAPSPSGRPVPVWSVLIPVIEALSGEVAGPALGCRLFFRRARQVERELQATVMKDPQTPPDLSTLGGGIEQWRGLEQMHEQTSADDGPEQHGPQ